MILGKSDWLTGNMLDCEAIGFGFIFMATKILIGGIC